MITRSTRWIAAATTLLAGLPSPAQIRVVSEHIRNEDAGPDCTFKTVTRPARTDAAAAATFTLVDGQRDPNGGDLRVLHDGQVPAEEDAPVENFFFRAGTDGGRLLVDLGRAVAIKEVSTFSWHPSSRGPQVYTLYASDAQAANFNAQPKRDTDPAACGWTLVTAVDTRPKTGDASGMHGGSISQASGTLGTHRYLLFDIFRTEDTDAFGNTFFGEIDVMDRDARARYDGSYRITANFVNWVTGKHGADSVPKLNAVIREGKYNADAWKQLTGQTVEELGGAWRAELEQQLGGEATAQPTTSPP